MLAATLTAVLATLVRLRHGWNLRELPDDDDLLD